MKLEVIIKHEDAVIPSYDSLNAAGFSLVSLQDVTIHPNSTTGIRTGLAFDVPVGFELIIRPCPDFCRQNDIRLASAPFSVSADNKDEVTLLMDNIANRSYSAMKILKGDKIGVAVLQKVERVQLVKKEKRVETLEKQDTRLVSGEESQTVAEGDQGSAKKDDKADKSTKKGKLRISEVKSD